MDFKDPLVKLIIVLPYNIEYNIDIMNEINYIFGNYYNHSINTILK